MNKLLVICGPTATGKTGLGISLAKKFNGEIVSADSRQVYRNMDIGTGKEWGEGVKIYGYDLVGPKEEFSVSQYLKFAKEAINTIRKNGKLPILVGGTGLYIKAVTDGIGTIDIPRNVELRNMLSKKTADELYESLSQIDSIRAASLNSSDKKNPRRLIRAVEIAQYSIDRPNIANHLITTEKADKLFIGLTAKQSILESKINNRVDARIKNGFEEEVKNLIGMGVNWEDQSMMSLGYRQWRDYVEGAVDKETVISEWKKEERKYSRRQMVWWKRDTRINWFDISTLDYQKKVENMIELWYSKAKSNATKN